MPPVTMEPGKQNLVPNPQTDANCFSKLLFWWTQHVLRLGYQHRLDAVDIYDVLPEDSSIKLANDLGREWEKESYKFKTGGRASLRRSLFTCYGAWVLATGLVFLLEEGLRLSQAVFLGLIISYFEEGSQMSTFDMYMYALGWSLSYLLIIVLDNIALHKSYYLGLKMRVSCTSLIYRKSCLGISYLWITPVETIAIISLLWVHYGLGAYCLLGVIVIIILSPVQFALGSYLAKLRGRMDRVTDRRMRAMNEIITGISSIKINCWEKPFSSLIHTLRRSEWLYLKAISHCRSLNSALHLTSGKLVMMATFMVYVFLGNVAPASVVFPALALYDVLRASLGLLLPWGIRHAMEVRGALVRLQHFLLLEERNILEAPTHLNILNIGRPPLPENIALHFENYSASWGKDHATSAIADVNIEVVKGQMLSIMGPGGSGKTSLIMALLGEIPRIGGFIRTVGKFAFVSQNPWVYSGSIRENIVFGTAMERRKYNKALQSCDLMQDLESLPDGDLSCIGENGVSLTNVQKAKVCLARAVYQDADTYLIDDILTVMDAKTAVQLFTKCFCGALNSKTILFVSSNLNFIRAADNIVIMKDGRIQSQGSFEDLKTSGVSLADLLADYGFPVASDTEALDLPLEIYETIKESIASIQSQSSLLSTLRQKLSGDVYSSEESLDAILVEYKQSGEKAQLLDDDQDCQSGGSGLRLYFHPAGGFCSILIIVILSILVQVAYILSDWWLWSWIQSQSGSTSSTNMTSSSTTAGVMGVFNLHFYIYLILVASLVAMATIRALLLSSFSIRISSRFHHQLFKAVMRAPVSFFKKYSPSRILSRFSRDMGVIDDPLPATLLDCIQGFFLILGAVIMVGVTNFWLFLVLVPLAFVFVYARFYYLQTARDIKHIELAARTPIYHHLSTTVEGLWTIRAFQSEERFVRFFDSFQDRHTASSYMHLAISRWFAIRLDLLSLLIVVPQAFLCILAKHYINGSLLGLSMAYMVNLMGLLQYAVRQSTELETQFSSVQRVHRFSSLRPEGEAVTAVQPSSVWPQYGIVTFEGVTMVMEDQAHKVLKNLWCCIRAEEKVGILGQPECSKQAFVSIILRLVEHTGTIRIDGLDISEIGLRNLREKISVVPQDPELFSGSVRRNLDPLVRFPDVLLWKVLSEVNLKDKIERLPGGMYADLGDHEDHLSLGERQLLCLARAILHNSKIIMMEETPSVLERRVANHISHILRTRFQHCTLIIIAQRIHTVIDADRVMLLDEGRVREFDSAHFLLQNTDSVFHRIVHQLPAAEVSLLEHMAREKYENKPYIPPPQALGGDTTQPIGIRGQRHFLPSFQTSRLSGVLSHFSGNRFSTNRF